MTVVFRGDEMARAVRRPATGPPARSGSADRAQDGFAEFYAASFQALATQLYVYTGDLAVAQDLVQEAYCRALSRWPKLSAYDDPVAWVRRVAFNLANSRWRRARVASRYLRGQRERQVDGPSPDRVAAVTAIAQLPAAQRRAAALMVKRLAVRWT